MAEHEFVCLHICSCVECMDQVDHATTVTAKALEQIALTGEHGGAFGGAEIEQAARTIQALKRQNDKMRSEPWKFALFYGANYYPSGGMGDFHGLFDTVEQAKAALTNLGYHDQSYVDWAQIAEVPTMKTLFRLRKCRWDEELAEAEWEEG